MPTEIHDSHQQWIDDEKIDMIAAGFMSYAEAKVFKPRVVTSKSLILYTSPPLIYQLIWD